MVSMLIGTVLGGFLAILGGYLVGLKQRSWQKEQALFERDLAKKQAQFERELSITKALDGSLVEAERRILGRGVPEGESPWEMAHREWEEAWVRVSPLLVNRNVKDRYESAGRMLAELVLYDGNARLGRQKGIALRATLNARQVIAYFSREEEPSSPCFPSPDVLTRLLGEGDPDPLLPDQPLQQWLNEHPMPDWHPERVH
jgi:hypothetical protein